MLDLVALALVLGAPPADEPVDETADPATEPAPVEVQQPAESESGVPVPVELEPEPAPPEPEPEPAPVPAVAPEPDVEEEPDDYDPRKDSPEALRARGWIVSGGTALGVGVGLGIGSIVMGTSDPCNDKNGNNCFEDARNRAALSMGIPAAILVAGGAAMLTYGLLKRRKLRRELAIVPTLGPGSFGLQF